jgi:GntR family transcriptional regulator
MVQYRASRGTVREALDLLRRSGVVVRQQGTGTFIVARAAAMAAQEAHGLFRVGETSSFTDHVTQEIERAVVPLPGIVARRLGAESGRRCLRVEYVALAQGEPRGLATNYVTYPEAAALEDLALDESWYHLMFKGGLKIGQSELVIGCVNADDHTASLLNLPPGHAVLTMEQVIRDSDGRAFNFAFISTRGDRTAIVARARRDEVSEGPAVS